MHRNFGDYESSDTEIDEDVKEELLVPNYFLTANSRPKTSNRLLREEDLACVQEHKDSVNYLESDELRADLFARYDEKNFSELFLLLREGFNVLIHGFGSKRSLIEKFAEDWLCDEHTLTIYGFFPEMTTKHVLAYVKDVLRADDVSVEALYNAAEDLDFDIYIVIHSLDYLLSISCPKLKPILVDIIAKSGGRLKLVGTVDHIHSGLLFSSTEKDLMNIGWMALPTLDSYNIERGYLSSFDKHKSAIQGHLTLSAIEHVYECLNPNAQKIFIQILNYYLTSGKPLDCVNASPANSADDESDVELSTAKTMKKTSENCENALPFATLYRICREEYLVNSEITLKAQLTEFKDHKLIKVSKRIDGTQVVMLLISKQMAQKFIEKVEESL